MTDDQKPPDLVVEAPIVPLATRVQSVVAWQTATFGHLWFRDVLAQVPPEETGGAEIWGYVRRQVLFALCFFESWFFEWIRDEILNKDFVRLLEYFPAGVARPVTERVKEVAKKLHADGFLSAPPDFSGETWECFCQLVEDRNGLVHGGASRPKTAEQPETANPTPDLTALKSYAPDKPIRIVVAVVDLLCGCAGDERPAWIKLA